MSRPPPGGEQRAHWRSSAASQVWASLARPRRYRLASCEPRPSCVRHAKISAWRPHEGRGSQEARLGSASEPAMEAALADEEDFFEALVASERAARAAPRSSLPRANSGRPSQFRRASRSEVADWLAALGGASESGARAA